MRIIRRGHDRRVLTSGARDVCRAAFPQEHALQLRDMMLEITSRAIAGGRNKVILRKLFVAVSTMNLADAPRD